MHVRAGIRSSNGFVTRSRTAQARSGRLRRHDLRLGAERAGAPGTVRLASSKTVAGCQKSTYLAASVLLDLIAPRALVLTAVLGAFDAALAAYRVVW